MEAEHKPAKTKAQAQMEERKEEMQKYVSIPSITEKIKKKKKPVRGKMGLTTLLYSLESYSVGHGV